MASPLLGGMICLLAIAPGYSLEFPQTSDRGAPARTIGGGTRTDRCEASSTVPLMALVPHNNVSTFVGEQATLWMHIPSELTQKDAEIFIQDPQTREVVYQARLDLADVNTTGVIPISLPKVDSSGATLLETNRAYFWEFAVICDPADRTRDHLAQGHIQQVEMSSELSANLANATTLHDKAVLYAEAEIWQETLGLASELRRQDPHLWTELLNSVGLEAVAEEALLECCRLEVQ
ncbi:MAG: DUF928 domain-containing protein [Cyanobacteria bacterium J06632_3]